MKRKKKTMMDINLAYALTGMGILGSMSGLYHLFFGNYKVISLISLVACIAVTAICYKNIIKYKRG